jgi:type I restriction enzyme R subunit
MRVSTAEQTVDQQLDTLRLAGCVECYGDMVSEASTSRAGLDQCLAELARDLVKSVRESVTIDWNPRETVRAGIKLKIKRILRKHGHPPETTDKATERVLEQAEFLCQAVA